MSHGLTVPAANQSPYPLQEPPHAPRTPVPVAKKRHDGHAGTNGRTMVVGAAIGLGALAAVAAAVFGFRARRD